MTLQEESISASASGILQCLRLLAEEAATLNLHHTLLAIENALAVVEHETTRADADARTVH